MDPPDVLGMDPNADRPTKLPNRAKSKAEAKLQSPDPSFFFVSDLLCM